MCFGFSLSLCGGLCLCLFFLSFFDRCCGLGREEHGHIAALKLGLLIHVCGLTALSCEFAEDLLADIGMSHFSAAETNGNLYAVAVSKELLCAFELGVKVILADAGRHANFLDFHNALVLLSFLFSLCLFEAELAVVHNLADRGLCLGRDFDEIKISFLGNLKSFFSRHDTELFSVFSDNA